MMIKMMTATTMKMMLMMITYCKTGRIRWHTYHIFQYIRSAEKKQKYGKLGL